MSAQLVIPRSFATNIKLFFRLKDVYPFLHLHQQIKSSERETGSQVTLWHNHKVACQVNKIEADGKEGRTTVKRREVK